jgi:hypothetical protein
MDPREAIHELHARIARDPIDPREVARFLDALDSPARVAAVRDLGRPEQRRLYRAVDGFLPLRLVDLVPPSCADLATVRHYGRNTLPAFTLFEKRFCRPRGADARKPGELWGFNFQALSFATGPGYFVAREDPNRPEVWVDYTEVPPDGAPQLPPGWPPVRRNEQGLSRFVYGFMLDTLRRVSEHVSIGSAARRGREIGSWFVLSREA